MIKILIVDDHPLVKAGIKEMIQSDSQIQLAGEASSGKEAKEIAIQVNPEVVLLDVSLPDCNGTDLIQDLKSQNKNTKVVMLSMHQEPEFIRRAIQNGADGYVLKSSQSQEILKAIHSTQSGKAYFPEELARVAESAGQDADARFTDRELEVLQWVAKGLSAKQIAEKLSISHRTVEVHKQNMMHKSKTKNIADLVRYAFTTRLVS
jgi:DNA-binding NarL/FixJ family response regulator